MTSAAKQYRAWCHYLFEHGTVDVERGKKYLFGLPLRFKGPHVLTQESPAILEKNKTCLRALIDKLSPHHYLILGRKLDCELAIGPDIAQVTFVTPSKVTICCLVTQPKSLTLVHAATLLFSIYFHHLLSKRGLSLLEWTVTFSYVYTTDEEEAHIQLFDQLNDAQWSYKRSAEFESFKSMELFERQQQQNDDIVEQFKEFWQHMQDNYKLAETLALYGYALILHVDSGIVPKLTGDEDYLCNFCDLLTHDMILYGNEFVDRLVTIVVKQNEENVCTLRYTDGITCVFSCHDSLYVNVLFPKMELYKYKTLVTRLVAFLQLVAVQSGVVLSTVVITCAALKQKCYRRDWLENQLKKPLPRPFTLHDFPPFNGEPL